MKHAVITGLIVLISSLCMSQPFGNTLYLDGVDNYLEVPNNLLINQDSTITIEAWINPCKVDGDNFIVTNWWCGGFQNAYYFNIYDGKIVWAWDVDGCGNGVSEYESAQPIVQANTWQHIAVVHNAGSITLYYNGVPVSGSLVSGSYSPIQSSSEPLRIGTYRALSSGLFGFFEGAMDEFRIWDYDLSASDILSRYNSPLTGSENGLILYFDMDTTANGSGVVVSNNATLTGTMLDGITVGSTYTPSFQAPYECVPVGIEENEINAILIYPIPTDGLLTISADGLQWNKTSLKLYTALGQIVFDEEMNNLNATEHTLDISKLPVGVYQLVVTEDDRKFVGKVLVE